MNKSTSVGISLQGLTFAPPQTLGGVKLIPLIRAAPRPDLRLTRRAYGEDFAVVSVDRRTDYISFVPHGLVANWTTDGGAVFGSQMASARKTKDGIVGGDFITARGLRKMVLREGRNQLRFLPLHVAMEGLLALHFGGPDLAWTEYSTQAIRSGLSPRWEMTVPGRYITGLEDALRLFEIHQNQTGVLVFVANALASAFVVPHPEDYAHLHATLLTDFYGELIWQYGLYATETVVQPDELNPDAIDNLADLRAEVERLRARWSALGASMSPVLFERKVDWQQAYRFAPFTLRRFITDLDPTAENHLGEAIYASDDGSLQYLKTYRLSAAQTRRAYLLEQLARHGWNLESCAAALGYATTELILRLENAGFGYLLHQHILDAARAKEKRRR